MQLPGRTGNRPCLGPGRSLAGVGGSGHLIDNLPAVGPRPDSRFSSPVGVTEVGKKRVCTMCTLSASDCGVLGADRAGFRMFPREPSVSGGWNAVRVPPRAQCFRRSEAF